MNVECSMETLEEIETAFKFNDAVLRNLIIKRKNADTDESPLMKIERESKEKKARDDISAQRAEAAAAAAAVRNSEEDKANSEAEAADPADAVQE
jgi:small subunit ribosomal protein S6